MITLAPMDNGLQIAEIFAQKGIKYNEFCGCVAAKMGDELLGFCLYELDNKRITVHYLEPLNDIPLADGILRSTLHVAAERSIMNAYYAETLPESFLKKIGFIKDENEKTLNIDKLFQSCCNC